MNIQTSKCDPYREKFLLTERVIIIFLYSINFTLISYFEVELEGPEEAEDVTAWTGGD